MYCISCSLAESTIIYFEPNSSVDVFSTQAMMEDPENPSDSEANISAFHQAWATATNLLLLLGLTCN